MPSPTSGHNMDADALIAVTWSQKFEESMKDYRDQLDERIESLAESSDFGLDIDVEEKRPTITPNDIPPRPHRLRMRLCLLYGRAVRVVMS